VLRLAARQPASYGVRRPAPGARFTRTAQVTPARYLRDTSHRALDSSAIAAWLPPPLMAWTVAGLRRSPRIFPRAARPSRNETNMSIDTLNCDEAHARMKEIHERLVELAGKHRMSKADDTELAELTAEFEALARRHEAAEREEQLAAITGAARGGGGSLRIERGSITDPGAGRDAAEQRALGGRLDSAMRQLERSVKGGLPARAAEVVERLVDTGTDLERSWVSRWVTDTASPEYRSAFSKLVMFGVERAGLEFTPAERSAYDRVARLKSEQRAMSLTDSAGGFLVPFELDPTIILTSAGSSNPLLQIANVKTVTTDAWHGVTSAGVQFSWDAEASEVSDDSPPLAEPTIPNYKMQGWIPFSVELQGDAVALVTEIGNLLSDGATQILNDALTTGSGVGCPTGIVTALAGGSSVVATGTGGTLAASDIYSAQNSLPLGGRRTHGGSATWRSRTRSGSSRPPTVR
jgi:HK97 family phage major capsid protein